MRPADDRLSTDRPTDRRVTVVEAATILGITPDAVRSRLRRGTLERDEAEDGTVLVVLGGDGPDDQPTDRPTDRTTVAYINALKSQIGDLGDQLSFLRAELVTRNEELRRKDHIIAALAERIPAIEPPKEAAPVPREGPLRTSEKPSATSVPPEEEERSWWRKLFGG